MQKKGTGSFRTRKDGTIEYRFSVDGERTSVYGRTEAECLDKAEIKKRSPVKMGMSYGRWMDRWLADYVKPQVAPATYKQYLWASDKITDRLGKKRVDKIREIDLQRFLNAYADKSKSQQSLLRVLLYGSFKQARKNHLCAENIADSLKINNKKRSKPKEAWTDFQIEEIMKYTSLDDDRHPYSDAIIVLLNTGLRSGELRGLRWKDVSLTESTLTVAQAASVDDKGAPILQEGHTKTETSARIIPIPNAVVDVLTARKDREGCKGNKALIFPNGSNSVMSKDTFRRRHISFFKDMNERRLIEWEKEQATISEDERDPDTGFEEIPTYTPHVCRHTYASVLMRRGIPTKIISELMGHTSTEFSEEIYMHGNMEDMVSAIKVL